ncbi:MAG: two-component system, OmpR family, response regulator [Chloroflexota bacterium]|jgi:two-component system OmpR family response regulator|nr:two-component system, OmpR family, response regulator [Chloroflexota bacterium]
MKILLVEDDVRLSSLLLRGLRRDGHAVDRAATIEDGRWLATESTYDVMIFDVMLPDGDGYSLCRELRDMGRWSPVMFLTARDAVEDRVRGLDAGGDDYLVKPFAFTELLARLRALTRRGSVERPAVLKVGDLEIDPAARRATAAERELSLTSREFTLLEHFARNVDAVLSRTDILDQVWDWAFEGSPRIIDVYVSSLRESLSEGPMRPRIETVRGAGYVLRSPPDPRAT